jgi:hypothetical protein
MTKPRKCELCKNPFIPARPLQNWCSIDCAVVLGQQAVEKKKAKEKAEDRKQTREKLAAMEKKSVLVKRAQRAVNLFIKMRDWGKPCISCNKPHNPTPNYWDAGHFRSVGSAVHMRFIEENIHGQCKECNNWLGGNVLNYEIGLIERIGQQAVNALKADQTLRKYSRDDLIAIAAHYNEKARQLKKQINLHAG